MEATTTEHEIYEMRPWHVDFHEGEDYQCSECGAIYYACSVCGWQGCFFDGTPEAEKHYKVFEEMHDSKR